MIDVLFLMNGDIMYFENFTTELKHPYIYSTVNLINGEAHGNTLFSFKNDKHYILFSDSSMIEICDIRNIDYHLNVLKFRAKIKIL